MASKVLSEYLNHQVLVVTTDGCLYVGVLEGYDHSTNVVLRNSLKREITTNNFEEHQTGLFVIRGDCVSVIGKTDPKLEARIDWSAVRAKPLKRIR